MRKNQTFRLVVIAMLTALSILLARVLGFYIAESVRISFECVPILLAGIWLGPIAGAVVGGVADFLGAMLSGLGFYPPMIITPICVGLISGLLIKWKPFSDRKPLKLACVVLITDLVCSVLIGSEPLSLLYGTPYLTQVILRLPWKTLIAVCDLFFVSAIHRLLYPTLIKKMLQ